MKKYISGIIAPITTPFVDDEVSFNSLENNVRKYAMTPLSGFFVLGSNGENKSLRDSERLKILETVAVEKNKNQIIIAGISHESTCLVRESAEQFANIGVNFISVLPPSYFKKQLTEESLISFFLEVAEKSPAPILVYNAPGFNNITISLKVLEKIMDHPNIFGMKDSSPGQIFNYLEISNDRNFNILSGTMNTFFPAMLLGAMGGVLSLANVFPNACCDLFTAIKSGSLEEAEKNHKILLRLNRAISGSFGVAGVKYAMDLSGFFGGLPRRPLLHLSDMEKKTLQTAISNSGISFT